VPRLSVARDYDDGAKPGRKRLLALPGLRGGLERFSTGGRAAPGSAMAVSTCDLTRALEELMAALERRVPRVERAGEAAIARDAAALRAKAIERLAELANHQPVGSANERVTFT